jgi:hypothetical protein
VVGVVGGNSFGTGKKKHTVEKEEQEEEESENEYVVEDESEREAEDESESEYSNDSEAEDENEHVAGILTGMKLPDKKGKKDRLKAAEEISKAFDRSTQGPLSKKEWEVLLEPLVDSSSPHLKSHTYCVPIYGLHRETNAKYHAVCCIPESSVKEKSTFAEEDFFLLDTSLQRRPSAGLRDFEVFLRKERSKKFKTTFKIDLSNDDHCGKPLVFYLASIKANYRNSHSKYLKKKQDTIKRR